MKFRIVQIRSKGELVYDVERRILGRWWSVNNDICYYHLVDAEDYVKDRIDSFYKKKEKKRVIREYDSGDRLVDKLKGTQS